MSVAAVSLGLPTGVAGWKLLQGKAPTDFKAFAKDPALQRDLAYLREKLPTKQTAKDLLADRRLQTMVLKAYGLEGQVGYDALIRKVLESNPDDSSSVAGRMTDYRYRQISRDLNYGGITVPEIPAVPSTTTLQLEGLMPGQSFTVAGASFAGVTVNNIDLRGLSRRQDIAAALQDAFRKADGGAEDISVTALGLKLVITDARGRGRGSFSFVADPESTARAFLVSETAGSQAVPGSGGPKVGDKDTIDFIVGRYTQIRFEEALGESSETLRRAVYAKRMLPQMGSWYSIIADRNLAQVVQSVLGLPDSFGRLDVDRQKAELEKRMSIADFKDPAKLSRLLDRYVAQGSVAEAKALSSSGLASLVQPLGWGDDRFSGASAAALLSLTRF
ncbi:DUF1217 domain-containing protein [Pseudoroseomonas cervicalis]|uniref:DUF1217 domain-containing protein n=1 Tax=Teichococcus cervicalis TaxID=204525 RepID=UPI0022F1B4E2|nr:DUF1217 domain-containing protein [Pseudoroseomonas cervicalis]WBV45517.1 DUF1217 domain-containing protein [Pseudoroseomonas cervicalis]